MNRLPNLPPLVRDELLAADTCLAGVPMANADGRLVLVPITPAAPVRYVLAEGAWTPAPTDGPFRYNPYGELGSSDEIWRSDAEGDSAWSYMHRTVAPDPIAPDEHHRLRDFCPELGRWKTQEPVAYVEGTERFEYVLDYFVETSEP